MKIFLTGGTGYFGSVLVERLVADGHDVSGLTRSTASADALRAAGVTPVHGSLSDTAVLASAAAEADAVVHAAVDYAMTEESTAVELAAVAALVRGAADSQTAKPFVFTSTGLVYGFDPAQEATEDAILPAVSAQPSKVAGERIVLDETRIAGIVVRAGLVFGRGGSGLITGLITGAQAGGASVYIGEGANSWRPVHVEDLAALYSLALANPAPGVYNAVGPVPFTFRELAEAVGELTGTPAASITLETAEQGFGPAARLLTTTSRLVATKARDTFGWTPTERSVLEDVRTGSYTSLVPAAG